MAEVKIDGRDCETVLRQGHLRTGQRVGAVLAFLVGLGFLLVSRVFAQDAPSGASGGDKLQRLTLNTDAVAPGRFFAVHGRRSLISGYADSGLEVWGYPLQILDEYRISFRLSGQVTVSPGASLLRRITYEPDVITRTYVGADFIVRERLFVPLDEPAAIVTYEVDSKKPVEILVRFRPILNLMWPAAIGGQSVTWETAASAYILREPTNRFAAFIGSPDAVGHDEVENSAGPGEAERTYSFAIEAGGAGLQRRAVYAGRFVPKGGHADQVIKSLAARQSALEQEARQHYDQLLDGGIEITTPVSGVNQALAWAKVALDQAWVCNPDLGCGIVGGYGPSRDARRPQYDWFFAGDGLVAVDGLLSEGQFARAKEELEFITRYQDQKTGMVWHELSQSAGLLDWTGSYPYMFVHVDITFQYLGVVAHYVAESGDLQFAERHWTTLLAAYHYCRSLMNVQDGLPRIPSSKEGNNEQNKLRDELSLSTAWVSAAAGFGHLARLTGHRSEAADALRIAEQARSSLATRYWDPTKHTWIEGYNEAGQPVLSGSVRGAALVSENALSRADADLLLDKLASAEFQTDWGVRGVPADSASYDPNSYARGSVWATGTASLAANFWSQHRPAIAYPLWRSLVSWNTLDSLGHMHEVLAGDYYHPQTESVPEQTWSSAAFLSSFVDGVLGLRLDGHSRTLDFAPHLPPDWDEVSVRNVRLPDANMELRLTRRPGELELAMENDGAPVSVTFAPELPFTASVTNVQVNNVEATATLQANEQDTHVLLKMQAGTGKTRCVLRYAGGVSVTPDYEKPMLGSASVLPKITGLHRVGERFIVDADVDRSSGATFQLRTTLNVTDVEGADLSTLFSGSYRLKVAADKELSEAGVFRHVHVAFSAH